MDKDKNKISPIGEISKIMDYISRHACSDCKYLEIDKPKTLELSKTNRQYPGDQKIIVVIGKCTKREGSKTVEIKEGKVYKGTGLCFNSKYLDYEINK